MSRPPKLYQYQVLNWKKLPKKQIHVILEPSSAKQILKEWNLLFEGSYVRSIYVRALIRRIEKHLNK